MRVILLFLSVPGLIGCTQTHVTRNTIRKANTLTDLYQQQVLDNLAMFVHDPNAVPHFALADQGTSQVVDDVSGESDIDWNAFGFTRSALGFGGGRTSTENWILKPITDPHKLALMRCAYQQAITSCFDGLPRVSVACPDCDILLEEFYANHSHGGTHDSGPEGRACIAPYCCWFAWGTKDDVPKEECLHVGRYCDTYVWVPPCGTEHLARLTFAILDFAFYEPVPPTKLKKQVTYFLDAQGTPTSQATAVQELTALIPVDELNDALLEEPLKQEVQRLNERLRRTTDEAERTLIEQRLFRISERLQQLALAPVPAGKLTCDTPDQLGQELGRIVEPLGLQQKFLLRRPATERALGLQELQLRLEAASP